MGLSRLRNPLMPSGKAGKQEKQEKQEKQAALRQFSCFVFFHVSPSVSYFQIEIHMKTFLSLPKPSTHCRLFPAQSRNSLSVPSSSSSPCCDTALAEETRVGTELVVGGRAYKKPEMQAKLLLN